VGKREESEEKGVEGQREERGGSYVGKCLSGCSCAVLPSYGTATWKSALLMH